MKKVFFVSFFFVLFSFVFAESWYVCVGSFTVERYAVNFCNELKAEGFQPFIEPAASKAGGQLYRVMIGEPSQSQNDARGKRDEFSRSAFARRKNISGAWICQAPIHTAEIASQKTSSAPARKVVRPKKKPAVSKTEERVQKNDAVQPVENVQNKPIVLPPKEDPPMENNVPPQQSAPAPVQEQEEEKQDVGQDEETVVLKPVDETVAEPSEAAAEPVEEASKSSEVVAEDAAAAPAQSPAPVQPAEDLKKQNEVVQLQNAVVDEEINALSPGISKNVKVCLDRLPANKNFSVESMKVFDVDNIRKKSSDFNETFSIPMVGEAAGGAGSFAKCIANIGKNSNAQDGRTLVSSVGEEIAKSVNAYAFASYKDNSNKSLAIFVAVSEGAVFEEPAGGESNSSDEKLDFSLKYGVLKSVISQDGGNLVLTASTENKKCFIKLVCENFTKDDLTAFMGSYNSEGFFHAYPYLQKTFAILPEDAKGDFLCYDIRKIEMDYVEARGFVEWSMKMLGLYNASFTLNQDGRILELGLFDLIDEDTATDAYDSFKDEQNKGSVAGGNRSQMVNGAADGFLLEQGVRELSFATNENIFYIMCDIDSALTGNSLSKIAESLKIWE